MAHNHEFDCRICGAHLDSRQELDQHNKDEHVQQASSSTAPDESETRSQSEPEDSE